MVAVFDPFRAHWEAEDEFRKIGETEGHAEWLLWFLGTDSSAQEGAAGRAFDDRSAGEERTGPVASAPTG